MGVFSDLKFLASRVIILLMALISQMRVSFKFEVSWLHDNDSKLLSESCLAICDRIASLDLTWSNKGGST